MKSGHDQKKVFVLGKDNVGWALDTERRNIIKLFQESADFQVVENILVADIVYSVFYDALRHPYLFYGLSVLKAIKKIKIFSLVTNDIEDTPEKIEKLKKLINVWVSPSSKTQAFLIKSGVNAIHIPFLVEKDIFFRTNDSKNVLAEKLGIDKNKLNNRILIGSFQRDSLGSDLSQPKWQKNPKLLVEILKNFPPEKILLILAGPRRHYIINECRAHNIPYLFIGNEQLIDNKEDDLIENNLSLEKINLLYNLIDVYLVTSKSEGGPLAVLECALTQTLIFSTNVGLARDFLEEQFLYDENKLQPVVNEIQRLFSNSELSREETSLTLDKVMKALDEATILQKIKGAFYEN